MQPTVGLSAQDKLAGCFGAGVRSTPLFRASPLSAPTPTGAGGPPEHDAQWRVFRCSQFRTRSTGVRRVPDVGNQGPVRLFACRLAELLPFAASSPWSVSATATRCTTTSNTPCWSRLAGHDILMGRSMLRLTTACDYAQFHPGLPDP